MAAYPALGQTYESTRDPEDGRVPVRATNGALRIRLLYPADKTVIELEHELDAAQKATLDAFYAANRAAPDIVYTDPDGTVYTVAFLAPPRYTPMPVGWWTARVRLGEI